jgi:hypothetical protein
MSKTSVWIGNKKGGVGKSTVAMALIDGLRQRGGNPAVVDVDLPTDEEQIVTTLCTMYPEAVKMRIAPAKGKLSDDPLLVHTHWNPLHDIMTAGDTVVDFGANVVGDVLDWAASIDLSARLIKHDVRLDVVAVATANAAAVDQAAEFLAQAGNVLASAGPLVRRFLLFNWHEGGFDLIEHSAAVKGMRADKGIAAMTFPNLRSEIWQAAEKRRLSPLRVLGMSEDEMIEEFGLGELLVSGGQGRYRRWFEKVCAEFEENGLLPLRGGEGLLR